MFLEYILSVHRQDLLDILTDPGLHNSYSVKVDFLNLFETDPNTGDGVLCNSKNTLAKCDEDLLKAQRQILEEVQISQKYLSFKQNVHARFYGLPVCPELHRITIPKNKDMGCFLKLAGTAVRVTQSKMLEYRRTYKCLKCQYLQIVDGKYEQRYVIKAPTRCKNPDTHCRNTSFSPVHTVTRENCKDYQELKIQEQVNKLTVGGIPGSIWVTLEDDLVDCCKPGDDVSICGTVMRRWNPISVNKKCDVELVFKANHIEVCNAQKAIAISIAPDVIKEFEEFWSNYETCPMKGRDIILASVCPKVYGLYMVKLALTLTVITGSSHNLDRENLSPMKKAHSKDDEERSVRGQCHLLLVGDPGTGKSQLLKAGAMMLPRSVLTSGSGSTKAGLTCTAMREDGEWQLEAGALVLADGGACCIDELAQMREHDRASIHEAMEQQTISVAKAGIICKLNTRCAVIGACNPKGNYDTEQPLSINVSLGTPLLSRFDLIFILLDTQNSEWDDLVSDYVLFGKASEVHPKSWSLDKLQSYMSLIGPFEVKMSAEANIILRAYYVRQRNSENRDPSRTTVRMLDSLVRLSQAHARLMYRHTVLPMDAIAAVSLMDLSMQDCTLSDTSDALHSNFSEYPDYEYLKIAKSLLSSLNLFELWHSELTNYSKLLNVNRQDLESCVKNGNTKYFSKNSLFDITTKDTEEVTEIVESSFFNSSINVDNSQRKNESIDKSIPKKLFGIECEKDEDLDSILEFDSYVSQNRHNSSIKNLKAPPTELEKHTFNNPSNKNTTSANLLAQTLKKHSGLNKVSNINVEGIVVAGKRKRSVNKNKDKSSSVKKLKVKVSKPNNSDKNDLQSVLNEINGSRRKNKNKKLVNQGGELNPKDRDSDVNYSSEEEINERDLLNCLPSVNDVFKDISMQFNLNGDDEISIFNDSQSPETVGQGTSLRSESNEPTILNPELLINEKTSTKASPVVLEKENNIVQQNDKEQNRNINKISPVSLKTLNKLQKFYFSASKTVDKCKPVPKECNLVEIFNSDEKIIKEKHLPCHKEESLVSNTEISKSNFLSEKHTEFPKISSNTSSQMSIFENEDEDYNVFDI